MNLRLKFVLIILTSFPLFISNCTNMLDKYRDHLKTSNPPEISFENIQNYQILNELITVTGSAYDDKGIESVMIYVDDLPYNIQNSDNWSNWWFDLNQISLAEGEHEIAASASDYEGNETTIVYTVYYLDGPDLQVANIDNTGISINRQTLSLSGNVDVQIINNSIFDIRTAFAITLFEDANNNQGFEPELDNIIGSAIVQDGLSAGNELAVYINISGTSFFADNIIYAFIDSDNSIMETDEDNNIANNMTGCEYTQPVGSFDPVIEWHWAGSIINPLSNNVMCAPVVANLNDDNNDSLIDNNDIPDIVFTSYIDRLYNENGTLRAISGNGSSELFSITDYEISPGANSAVGDIDNDGLPEIIAISEQQYVLAFENDGAFKWISTATAGPFVNNVKNIALADIDRDGHPEIIVGDYVFNNDGSVKITGSGTYYRGRFNSIVANLDLDGDSEIVAGNTVYHSDGSPYWTAPAPVIDCFSAVGNFDFDNFPEVVIIANTGSLYLLEHDGQVKWGPISLPAPASGGGPPLIADVDNDGQPEIGVACSDYYVVLETDGSIKWTQPVDDRTSQVTGSTAFDFEGDGQSEIIYADQYYLRIYRGTDGNVLFETYIENGTLQELPVIADVDNDNRAEIIVTSNEFFPNGIDALTGIVVIGDANDTWVNTRKIWNQHSYHITNINDDCTIPRYETNSWNSDNSYRKNSITIQLGCYDISASNIRANTAGLPASAELTVRIGNCGALTTSDAINVSFYNGDPGSGGMLIGTKQITHTIDPGVYEDLTITWNNPILGAVQIFVKADDDGMGRNRIREVNEENNKVSALFQF